MIHDALKNEIPVVNTCGPLIIYADPCASQNEYKAMVSYLKASFSYGRHEGIPVTFMVNGYSRFSADERFANN